MVFVKFLRLNFRNTFDAFSGAFLFSIEEISLKFITIKAYRIMKLLYNKEKGILVGEINFLLRQNEY